ncbi:MAG: outer membrane protein transport protein [Planctomycetes bacterium]|nr:outer membrane protein transport protein [Planctomycetota bacterium]
MKKLVTAISVLALAVAGGAGDARADGFRLKVQSAKGVGQGLAFAASADDPTTIAYNPAGLHQLEGTQAAFTTALVYAPGNHFESDRADLGSETGDDQLFVVPSLFLSCDLGTKCWHVGLGVYSPFGLGRDFDEAGITNSAAEQRAAGMAQIVDRLDLMTVYVNPVAVYDVLPDKLSIAAGFIYCHSRIEIQNKPVVNLGAAGVRKLADFDQKAYGDGYTFNVGVHSKVTDQLRFGAYYRHKIYMDYDHGFFTANKRNPLVFGNVGRFQTREELDFSLPGVFGAGLNYEVCDGLTVELNGEHITWSEFDRIDVDLGRPLLSGAGGVVVNDATLSLDPNWEDSWAIRVGGQYQLSKSLAVRAGYYFESTPVPEESVSPSLADGDKHAMTLGAGYTCGKWTVDVAYDLVLQSDRDVNNTFLAPQIPIQDGTWSEDPVHVLMVTTTHRF